MLHVGHGGIEDERDLDPNWRVEQDYPSPSHYRWEERGDNSLKYTSKITSWFDVEDLSTTIPRCFSTLKSHLFPGNSLKVFPHCKPRIFLQNHLKSLNLFPGLCHHERSTVFLLAACWILFGCAELRIAQCQETQEPRPTTPSWCDSSLCNPGAVRLEVIATEVTEVKADENHPRSLLTLDRT